MVWCNHCGKNVPGIRPYDGALACDLCGRILENFTFSSEVTFVKNAAGQSQASGNIVRSVQSGISSSRERRIRLASEALNASNVDCPEYARRLVEASKAAVTKSRKEKRLKRAEEAKNAPPPSTAMEAVCRTLERKGLSRLINYDVLEPLFDTSPVEKSPKRSKTIRDMEEKKEIKSNEHENSEK